MTDLVDFERRLAKNARHLRRWAKRESVHAYRLYDRDVPEFPLVVDRFDDEDGATWLHVQEVDTGWTMERDAHREWLAHVVDAAAAVADVPASRVSVKRRARHRPPGAAAARRPDAGGAPIVVGEGGHRFAVDLDARLDTGLFLDHRTTRRMVGERAAGRRVLNLFAYTGSFTVYAARGGATSSESVDLSNTYCDWAERNLALNGVDRARHRVVRADVFAWLRDAVAAFEAGDREAVDLIVLDPPTFSNSKAMAGVLDIQRDHPWLIRQCLALLAPAGELFFATNLRTFALDALVQERASFVEISDRTIPPDFRDRRVHRCWNVVPRTR